jgi:hypothetical protein
LDQKGWYQRIRAEIPGALLNLRVFIEQKSKIRAKFVQVKDIRQHTCWPYLYHPSTPKVGMPIPSEMIGLTGIVRGGLDKWGMFKIGTCSESRRREATTDTIF